MSVFRALQLNMYYMLCCTKLMCVVSFNVNYSHYYHDYCHYALLPYYGLMIVLIALLLT